MFGVAQWGVLLGSGSVSNDAGVDDCDFTGGDGCFCGGGFGVGLGGLNLGGLVGAGI